jgi:hypothetical protein
LWEHRQSEAGARRRIGQHAHAGRAGAQRVLPSGRRPAPRPPAQRRHQATRAFLARESDWAELSADYEAAIAKPDYNQAGVLLNGMSEKDILERLRKLPVESVKAILAAAEVTMKGSPDRVPRLCRQAILEKPVTAGRPRRARRPPATRAPRRPARRPTPSG